MRCDFGLENLNALADGELNAWQKWRVKRHLSKCIWCVSEFAEIQKLSAQAREWRKVEPSAELKRRLKNAVFEAKPVVQNQIKTSYFSKRPILRNGLITASVLLVLAFIGASWFGIIKDDDALGVIKGRVAPALENITTAHLTYYNGQRKQRELWFQDGFWLEKTYGQNARIFHNGNLWQYDCKTQNVKPILAEGYPGAFFNDADFKAVRDELLRPGAETVKAYQAGTFTHNNGREINDYVLENSDSALQKIRLRLWVDMSENLPVAVEKQNLIDGKWTTIIKVDFEFNQRFPLEIFDIQKLGEQAKMSSLCSE